MELACPDIVADECCSGPSGSGSRAGGAELEEAMESSSGIELRIFFEGVAESTRRLQRLALFVGVDWVEAGEGIGAKDGNGR